MTTTIGKACVRIVNAHGATLTPQLAQYLPVCAFFRGAPLRTCLRAIVTLTRFALIFGIGPLGAVGMARRTGGLIWA